MTTSQLEAGGIMAIALNRVPTLDIPRQTDEEVPALRFAFTGRAGEYFGIWIVNLLLSVVTLGIYSAWAKVRTKRYFYGNTKLDGSAFDYLATPVQILKGRLIAFAFFFAYALCTASMPSLSWVFAVAILVLTPWAIVRSRAFNAAMTRYRNVRFGFDGNVAEAAKLYVLMPVLSMLTAGLIWPYVAERMDRFLATNSRYGTTGFTFDAKTSVYYSIYGVAVLFGVIAAILYGTAFIATVADAGINPEEVDLSIFLGLQPLHYLMIGIAVLLGLVGFVYLTVNLQNYRVSSTRIGGHQLRLDLQLSRVLWIRLSNLLAIALSFGLLIPWAKIRIVRYQIERMRLLPDGDLHALVDDQQGSASALGDEMGEGLDLGLGV
jgi:uncharacterized membrane protein YjgN (DUF898 family)